MAFVMLMFQEITFLDNRPKERGDKFVSVMGDFVTLASYNFSEIEEAYTEMKHKVGCCLCGVYKFMYLNCLLIPRGFDYPWAPSDFVPLCWWPLPYQLTIFEYSMKHT